MNGYIVMGVFPFAGLLVCVFAVGALVTYTILGFRRRENQRYP